MAVLSSDFRYFLSGYNPFRIREVATGQEVASIPWKQTPSRNGRSYLSDHEWASPEHFAQSIYFYFKRREFSETKLAHRNPGDPFDEVEVFHVPTGEVEIMDTAEYLARFHPEESRARAECPDDGTQPCRILLDGEVVGEGRWASIIGFIPLD